MYLNLGSAVILPEVFLKAVSLGRNLGHDLTDITTVDMDFLAHYRPLTNVVRRPTQKGGKGYFPDRPPRNHGAVAGRGDPRRIGVTLFACLDANPLQ